MKIETNDEFIVRIMNFGCPTGALAQVFILTAIERFADAVIAAPAIEHGLIDGEGWKRTAVWIKGQIENRDPLAEVDDYVDDTRDDEIAEWVGLHYGHNFDRMNERQKSVWRNRYAEGNVDES